jgi:two-component system, LuxR family, sensor kinase FixL
MGLPHTLSFDRLLQTDRKYLLGATAVLLAIVSWADAVVPVISLGVLYILPVLPASIVLNRWQIILFSLFNAWVVSLFFDPVSPTDAALRFALAAAAYCTTGLFLSQIIDNRRLMARHLQEMEREEALRKEAEEHLHVLAESSPAAVFTLDDNACILSANKALLELLALPELADPGGLSVASYLPVLADALKLDTGTRYFRTGAQCQGSRTTGELFVAQIWFSTYQTPRGRRLAAIAVDISEEMREREEQNLRHLLDNNRIIAGAVSHEIRNVCGAVSLVYRTLSQNTKLTGDADFQALGKLVEALTHIASTELHSRSKPQLSYVDLRELLTHLRIVIEPAWKDLGGVIRWNIPEESVPVMAEAFGLLQATLNLAQNSFRAVEHASQRELTITVERMERIVNVTFDDSGSGVQDPSHLFEPFQRGSESSGLGLYVSRAIVRSYGGDLRYEPPPDVGARGSRFVIELPSGMPRALGLN